MAKIKLLYKPCLLVFSVALLVRLTFLVFSNNNFIPHDEVDYNRLAISLSQGQGYVDSAGNPTSERPPLYPFFLGSIFFLFGHSLLLVKFFQVLIDAGTCALIYTLCKNVFDEKVAWISGILSVFHLSLILSATIILPETLFTFLLVLAVLYLFEEENNPFVGNQTTAGGILGLAALTRGTVLVFPLFVLFYFLWVRGTHLPIFKKWLMISASFSFVLLPWTLRNYSVHHELVPVATQAGYVFYSSYKPHQSKVLGAYTVDETVTYARTNLSEVEASRFLFWQTIRHIADDPKILGYLSFLKLAYFVSPFDWELSGGGGIYNFSYGFILPFALWGIYISLRRKKGQVLLLPIVHLLFVSLVFYGSPRLRVSVEPFLIIFAASTLYSLFKNRSGNAAIVGMILIVFTINVSFYIFSNDIKIFAAGLLRNLGFW